jgi:hypothetical protein
VFFFIVAVVQDDWGGAWFSLGLFTGYAALLAFLGNRVEVIGLLRGDTPTSGPDRSTRGRPRSRFTCWSWC